MQPECDFAKMTQPNHVKYHRIQGGYQVLVRSNLKFKSPRISKGNE